MNNRKYLLVILLSVLSIILVYNLVTVRLIESPAPYFGSGLNSPVYFIDIRCLVIIGLLLIGLLIFEISGTRHLNNVCSQCGKKIENSRWKVCPVCGTIVNVNEDR